MLIGDIVRRNAEFFADSEAVVVPGGRMLTWGELDVRTNRLARAFAAPGLAKAAILTQANAVAAILTWLADIPVRELGTILQNIPFFFNPGGPAGLHPVMVKGGRSVIPPAFEPGNFLRSVPEYGVTHCILVPTMIGMVLNHPECGQHDLSTLMGVS